MFLQIYDLMWDNHPNFQMGPADAHSQYNEVDTLHGNITVTMLSSVSDVLVHALDVDLAEKIVHFICW